MKACIIENGNLGDPLEAFKIKEVEIPNINDDDVLVRVKAAAAAYNCVWASSGKPVNVVRDDFHICGSGGSGIVERVGCNVTSVKVGDEVVISAGVYDNDKLLIWGYETNWGSFAEYCKVKDYQCLNKPPNVSFLDGSCLANYATVHKMLTGWSPHVINKGDPVLIWGGSGAVGTAAIRLVKYFGGVPIVVVSSKKKAEECMSIGAAGVLDRTKYTHISHQSGHHDSTDSMRQFAQDYLKICNKKPRIVIEHPGSVTLSTSVYICDSLGMVVSCGATTGYSATIDMRYVWIYQKRLQGSHFATRDDENRILELIDTGKLTVSKTVSTGLDKIRNIVSNIKSGEGDIIGTPVIIV